MKVGKLRRDRSSQQSGQDLVEFALILPLLLLVLVGVFDLGRAFYASIVLTNVAREGARFGSLNRDNISGVGATACTESLVGLDEIIVASCKEAGNHGLDITKVMVTPSCPNLGGCASKQVIEISVAYDFEMILSKLFSISDITLARSAKMLIQ